MTEAEVPQLLARQRTVSQHIANMERAGSTAARREYLRSINDDAIRDEVQRIFADRWERNRKTRNEGA